jgi:methylase of polypeptide subunit release factors
MVAPIRQAQVDLVPAQRLLERHRRHEKPYDVTIEGLRLRMLPGVFCPAYTNTSRFLAHHVTVTAGESVLDVFTGSGYQGIAVAAVASRVVCVDHSATAVACARGNAVLNGVADRTDVRCGDLFEPVSHERFDVVIANPPLIPGEPRDMLETAIFDRSMSLSRRFIGEVRRHLNPGGRVYLVFSDVPRRLGLLDLDRLCRAEGLRCDVLGERPVGYEIYAAYVLRGP